MPCCRGVSGSADVSEWSGELFITLRDKLGMETLELTLECTTRLLELSEGLHDPSKGKDTTELPQEALTPRARRNSQLLMNVVRNVDTDDNVIDPSESPNITGLDNDKTDDIIKL